jgi:hypothetical protein
LSPTMPDQSRSDGGLLARAEAQRKAAWRVLERFDLLPRWDRYGEPRVVGSVALGVVVRPDIDVAIVTDAPRVQDGFAVVGECAAIPGVLRGRFRADLAPGDPEFPSGLYWKLDYQADDGVVWTIDMWLLERGARGGRRVSGFAVCQAVVSSEVGSLEEFDSASRWIRSSLTPRRAHWCSSPMARPTAFRTPARTWPGCWSCSPPAGMERFFEGAAKLGRGIAVVPSGRGTAAVGGGELGVTAATPSSPRPTRAPCCRW